jgi:hypothetical protein
MIRCAAHHRMLRSGGYGGGARVEGTTNLVVGGLEGRPTLFTELGPLSLVASHLSKVLGQYAPSTVLYASQGVPGCKIHHHHQWSVTCSCCASLPLFGSRWWYYDKKLSRSLLCWKADVTVLLLLLLLCERPEQQGHTPPRPHACAFAKEVEVVVVAVLAVAVVGGRLCFCVV